MSTKAVKTESTKAESTKVSALFKSVVDNILSLESTLNVPGQLLQGKRNKLTIAGKEHTDIDWSATLNSKGYSAKKFLQTLAQSDSSQDALKTLVLGAMLEQVSREISKRAYYTLSAFLTAENVKAFIAESDMIFPDGTSGEVFWSSIFATIQQIALQAGYSNVADIFVKGKQGEQGALADFSDLIS